MSYRTLPTTFHVAAYPAILTIDPARRARFIAILRDAGAVLTVLSLVGVGCALPFCG